MVFIIAAFSVKHCTVATRIENEKPVYFYTYMPETNVNFYKNENGKPVTVLPFGTLFESNGYGDEWKFSPPLPGHIRIEKLMTPDEFALYKSVFGDKESIDGFPSKFYNYRRGLLQYLMKNKICGTLPDSLDNKFTDYQRGWMILPSNTKYKNYIEVKAETNYSSGGWYDYRCAFILENINTNERKLAIYKSTDNGPGLVKEFDAKGKGQIKDLVNKYENNTQQKGCKEHHERR